MNREAEHLPGASERDGVRGAGVDEDFLYHLHRGSELLASGKNIEARDELERAAHLRPHNQKAHNLLGLSYFKLGLLERAIEVYERLIQENPKDPTLRVNLGLVHLKAGQMGEAIAQLETVVELVPDHQKALNYLGLAYAQARDPGKARRFFERSGNSAMVRKMETAMRGDAEPGHGELGGEADLAPSGLEPGKERTMAGTPTDSSTTQREPGLRFGPATVEPLGLTELVRERNYDPPPACPFHVDEVALTLQVSGELSARLPRLLWMRGEITQKAEVKRFRGRVTEQPFGDGEDRVFRLQGNGVVVLSPDDSVFTPVDLRDETVYLVERSLFAFETSLGYENGRIAGDSKPELTLVHLRGKGQALLRSTGPLRSVAVESEQPIQLPVERLVGWLGSLTPTLFEAEESAGGARWARLQGTGWVLWATGPAGP
jgi:uncharacterized protein (AIM24 family)